MVKAEAQRLATNATQLHQQAQSANRRAERAVSQFKTDSSNQQRVSASAVNSMREAANTAELHATEERAHADSLLSNAEKLHQKQLTSAVQMQQLADQKAGAKQNAQHDEEVWQCCCTTD